MQTPVRCAAVATLLALALAGTAAATPSAHAQPTPVPAPPTQELKLDALGGATLQVPIWKDLRRDSGVAVFEQAPEPAANKPFYVLMCTLEEGPTKGTPVAWEKVRDNIQAAASKNDRKLVLEVKEPFTGATGFEARRLVGEFTSTTANKKVALELVALVKDGKLLTVGLVAEALGPPTQELVQLVAKSAKLVASP